MTVDSDAPGRSMAVSTHVGVTGDGEGVRGLRPPKSLGRWVRVTPGVSRPGVI